MTKESLIALTGLGAEEHVRTVIDWSFARMCRHIAGCGGHVYGYGDSVKRDNTYSFRLNSYVKEEIATGINVLTEVIDELAKQHSFKPLTSTSLAGLRQLVKLSEMTITVPDTRAAGAAAGGAGGGIAGTVIPFLGTLVGAGYGAFAGYTAAGMRDLNEAKRRVDEASASASRQLEQHKNDAAKLIIECCLS